MRINIVSNIFTKSSFRICVNNVIEFLRGIGIDVVISRLPDIRSEISIFIGDMNEPYQYGFLKRFIDVWWVDTATYEYFDYSTIPNDIWVTSKYNYGMIKKGIERTRIVHRILSPKYFSINASNVEKEFDFITIATDPYRKRLDLFRRICSELNARCIEISPISNIKPFSITEDEKIDLILKSRFMVFLSMSEGFGMPAVEANVLGVPVIYTDGHALHEIACGIPVKVKDIVIEKHVTGTFKFFVPDEHDAVEKASYALSMSRNEYDNLSNECKDISIYNQLKHINFVLNYISGVRY